MMERRYKPTDCRRYGKEIDMTLLQEILRTVAVSFGPILLAVLAFGLFRFWQVFLRRRR